MSNDITFRAGDLVEIVNPGNLSDWDEDFVNEVIIPGRHGVVLPMPDSYQPEANEYMIDFGLDGLYPIYGEHLAIYMGGIHVP